jgi:DNA-binding MarR family transcriptional regulator
MVAEKPKRPAALWPAFSSRSRGRCIRSATTAGCFRLQWSALRYFRDAVPPHNTAVGLARFQGLAFGPVSRTVRTLIEKGLLQKAGSAGRGRSESVEVTKMGRALLAADPLLVVAHAVETMPPHQVESLAIACETIIAAVHAQREDDHQTD